MCSSMGREMLDFETALMRTADSNRVDVMVKVKNKMSNQEITLTEGQFSSAASILSDEKFKLEAALQAGEEYIVTELHDPINVMYDTNQFHLGTADLFPEHLIYMFDTDENDVSTNMKRAVAPYDEVGSIRAKWTCLAGEDMEPGEGELLEINDPSELIGKSWTGKFEIMAAVDLPVMVDQAYVSYRFWGSNGPESFTTVCFEGKTHAPDIAYEFVHHVPTVTQDFIDFLQKNVQLHLYVSPYAKSNLPAVSTMNPKVRAALGGNDDPAADPFARIAALEKENAVLKQLLDDKDKEINDLRAELIQTKGGSSTKSKLEEAKDLDASLSEDAPPGMTA